MPKVLALVVAAALLSSEGSRTAVTSMVGLGPERALPSAESGITELIGSARGAPPMLCALASRAVRGFGNWHEAPVSPIKVSKEKLLTDRPELTREDTDFLVQSLSSDDACVRELSVRLVARRGDASVTREFISRLSSPTESVREVAALGLGIQEPGDAIDPLIHALRDAGSGVRANAAWALGMIENGKAVTPVLSLVTDREEIVREAAVYALGRLDSARAATSLVREVSADESTKVRRAAAWASPSRHGALGACAARSSGALSADPRWQARRPRSRAAHRAHRRHGGARRLSHACGAGRAHRARAHAAVLHHRSGHARQ